MFIPFAPTTLLLGNYAEGIIKYVSKDKRKIVIELVFLKKKNALVNVLYKMN